MYAMTDFVTAAGALPAADWTETNDANLYFDTISLLMGDAIGLRLEAGVIESDLFTIKVNDSRIYDTKYRAAVDEGTLTIDLYINANAFEDALHIEVFDAAGNKALDLTTTIAGYTAAVKNSGSKELALAQLVKACIDCQNETA